MCSDPILGNLTGIVPIMTYIFKILTNSTIKFSYDNGWNVLSNINDGKTDFVLGGWLASKARLDTYPNISAYGNISVTDNSYAIAIRKNSSKYNKLKEYINSLTTEEKATPEKIRSWLQINEYRLGATIIGYSVYQGNNPLPYTPTDPLWIDLTDISLNSIDWTNGMAQGEDKYKDIDIVFVSVKYDVPEGIELITLNDKNIDVTVYRPDFSTAYYNNKLSSNKISKINKCIDLMFKKGIYAAVETKYEKLSTILNGKTLQVKDITKTGVGERYFEVKKVNREFIYTDDSLKNIVDKPIEDVIGSSFNLANNKYVSGEYTKVTNSIGYHLLF